jgi:DNA ligase-1
MLAPHESVDLESFKDYPVYVSPKYDGIRCLIGEGGWAYSRTLKPIPNLHIRQTLRALQLPFGLDGELVSYTTGKMDKYSEVQSAVMSKYGTPAFLYHTFDIQTSNPSDCFLDRMALIESICFKAGLPLITNRCCSSRAEVENAELRFLYIGFEGVMLKLPHGYYKHGRCTLLESTMFKLKRFTDSEALVLGMEEELENQNPLDMDFAGHAKRGHSQEGMVPKGRMGKLHCRDIHDAALEEFDIGTGFTHADRDWWWQHRMDKEVIGKVMVKYKYQKHGTDKRPRTPVCLGIRNPQDI